MLNLFIQEIKMGEKDYSQEEIDNLIEELQLVHFAKLKTEELIFLSSIKGKKINQGQRDRLINMYDGMGEAGY